MMVPRSQQLAVAFAIPSLFLAACGDDPTTPDRPPELVSATVSNSVLVLEGLDRELTLTVRARDDFAVSRVEAAIGVSGGRSLYPCAMVREGEAAADAAWDCTITVPHSVATGLWAITEVRLTDAAGTRVLLDEDDLGVRFSVVESDAVEVHPRFIERTPRLAWDPDASDPSRDGWPAPGATVTWVGHIKSWSANPVEIGYAWELDGTRVAEGRVALEANGTARVGFDWSWTFDRHELALVVDTEDALEEQSETNNRLAVVTNALSVAAWVEESIYFSYRRNEPRWTGVGSVSFEDFVQRQVAILNAQLAAADFPESPGGVREAFRIDRIEIVGDFLVKDAVRPLPAFGDRTADFHYGWPEPFGDRPTDASFDARRDRPGGSYDLGFARAALRSRGATGLGRFVVGHGWWGHNLRIVEMGQFAVASPLMPGIDPPSNFSRRIYARTFGTLMDDSRPFERPGSLARPTAAMVQDRAGERPTEAVPADSGALLRRLPADNRIRALDPSGAPIAGATVHLYRGIYQPDLRFPFRHPILWLDQIAAEFVTGADGSVSLGPQPFADANGDGGPILPDEMVVVLRFEKEGRITYAYLDPIEFALARARGENSWEVPLTLELKVP